MNKHTPGPWKAVYVGCGDWDLNGPVTQEDWTLASAAPDLLEALKRIDAMCAAPPDFSDATMQEIACAAIAKATGEHHG